MCCTNTDETLITCVRLLTWQHQVLARGYVLPILHFNTETTQFLSFIICLKSWHVTIWHFVLVFLYLTMTLVCNNIIKVTEPEINYFESRSISKLCLQWDCLGEGSSEINALMNGVLTIRVQVIFRVKEKLFVRCECGLIHPAWLVSLGALLQRRC